MRIVIMITCLLFSSALHAQEITPADLESLKKEILQLRADVNQIQLNLETSQNKFKKGIIVATLGYTVTIAGGLMLGRKNDELGKVLLVSGGVTGITGTFMMVDAYKYLTRKGRPLPK